MNGSNAFRIFFFCILERWILLWVSFYCGLVFFFVCCYWTNVQPGVASWFISWNDEFTGESFSMLIIENSIISFFFSFVRVYFLFFHHLFGCTGIGLANDFRRILFLFFFINGTRDQWKINFSKISNTLKLVVAGFFLFPHFKKHCEQVRAC